MKRTDYILNAICFLLILLWIYAAVSKLSNFGLFKIQMHRQLLPIYLKDKLVYILPPVEIALALLLLFEATLRIGLYLSALILSAFTIYIGLAVFNMLGKVPCSCGGILTAMGWPVHLIFNIVFLLLTGFAIYIVQREGRIGIL